MTPAQCRAARAWLDMSQVELAEASRVGISTVRDFEAGKRKSIPTIVTAMMGVLEAKGLTFIFGHKPDGSDDGIIFGYTGIIP